jgi:hypothetical protein
LRYTYVTLDGFPVRAKGSTKVVHLSKCDGSPSNVGILLESGMRGSIIRRGKEELNCCPILLRHIWLGGVGSPSFPHAEHSSDFTFLKSQPDVPQNSTEAKTC